MVGPAKEVVSGDLQSSRQSTQRIERGLARARLEVSYRAWGKACPGPEFALGPTPHGPGRFEAFGKGVGRRSDRHVDSDTFVLTKSTGMFILDVESLAYSTEYVA